MASSTEASSEHQNSRNAPSSTMEQVVLQSDNLSTTALESATNVDAQSQSSSIGTLTRVFEPELSLFKGQSSQSMQAFFFPLLEGRCRARAREAINSKRHPGDHLPENHPTVVSLANQIFTDTVTQAKQANMISEDIAVPTIRERGEHMGAVDSRLDVLADLYLTKAIGHSTYRTIEESDVYSVSDDASSLFERPHSKALVPNTFMISPASPLRALMFPSGTEHQQLESPYHRKFEEISLLGKGGFGQVFRVRHSLDAQEYAVKKIRVSASQLRSIHNQVQLEHLLRELRALAKLQHRNVVRYYDSWWEQRPASIRGLRAGQHLLEDGTQNLSESTSSSSSAESEDVTNDALVSDHRNIQFGHEIALRKDAKRIRRESFRSSGHDESVLFEYSQSSAAGGTSQIDKRSKSSSARTSSLFYKPSELSDEDEDTEEVERSNGEAQLLEAEKDMIIFIQMAPYPLTLEDFIWSEQQDTPTKFQHCYHSSITAQILLAILDGVEYIHNQDIVHRDLKPSNIFLSLHIGKNQPEGSINVTACRECKHDSILAEQVFVTPHIGDFGLITKIDGSQSSGGSPAVNFHPSPIAILSSVTSTRQPGTRFYCPPFIDKRSAQVVCPKLDVYSIGVIAFEMVTSFGTKTERMMVLNDLNKGVLDALKGHVMEQGIKGMLDHDRETRWDCEAIRQWLCDIAKSS